MKALAGRGLPRPALLFQRLVVASDRGPARALWRLAYELVARASARLLTLGYREATAYVRGSMAQGDSLHGVSDIDVILVVEGERANPGLDRLRVWRRWQKARRVRALDELVHVAVYEQVELDEALAAPAPTFGLAPQDPPGAAMFTRTPYLEDELWLRARPGVYGPAADWRRLRGPERRPPAPALSGQDRNIAAWLELGWWWRHAVAACVDPTGPRTRHLGVKLVSEPLRVLLWLEQGVRVDNRSELLRLGAELVPAEREAVEAALALLQSRSREPLPVAAFMPPFARLSARVGESLATTVADAGSEAVALVGAGDLEGEAPLPLLDWRALVAPPRLAEHFELGHGSLGDPAAVAQAVLAAPGGGVFSALRDHQLLLLCSRELWSEGVLRTLQCPPTDPVSFALLDGRMEAAFPSVRGWSAHDVAARAVAEHAARLAQAPSDSTAAAGLALTAARAAGLAQSVEEGAPALAITPAAIAELLAVPAAGEAASALASGGRLPAGVGEELLRAARNLTPYAQLVGSPA